MGIAPEIGQQLLQPVLPLLIGGDLGRCPKAARPQIVWSQLLLEICPDLVVGDDDIRHQQPRQIEGLRGGGADDAPLDQLLLQSAIGHELPIQDQVPVDLVHGQHHAVLQTDAAYPLQLLPGPAAAHRVVRAAQDHELSSRVFGQVLQPVKVHLIPALPLHQWVKSDLPSGAADIVVIGVIHRGLDDHPVPRLGINLNATHQSHVHPGGIEDPVGPDVPAIAAFLPVHAGLKILR